MDDTLILSKTAELALEKDFDWDCFHHYIKNTMQKPIKEWEAEKSSFSSNWNSNYLYPRDCMLIYLSAPTQTRLAKWLREIHHINISITNKKDGYGYEIISQHTTISTYNAISNDYELTLEKALFNALKLINTEELPSELYEIAKEKGFRLWNLFTDTKYETAPTLAELKKWLLDVHNLVIEIKKYNNQFSYDITLNIPPFTGFAYGYYENTYVKALEDALRQGLTLIDSCEHILKLFNE